jgi:hypothetical protein
MHCHGVKVFNAHDIFWLVATKQGFAGGKLSPLRASSSLKCVIQCATLSVYSAGTCLNAAVASYTRHYTGDRHKLCATVCYHNIDIKMCHIFTAMLAPPARCKPCERAATRSGPAP